MRKTPIILILFICLFATLVYADSDISVFQGKYYINNVSQTGLYHFDFAVYDALTDGTACYTSTAYLTTDIFGNWYTEQSGINAACNNASKDYFLEITIEGVKQLPRRRITVFSFLRKNVDITTTGIINMPSVSFTNQYAPLSTNSININAITSNSTTISSPPIQTVVNQSGAVRNLLQNQNSRSDTSTVYTIQNDMGYQMNMVLTSSTYNSTGPNKNNVGGMTLNAPGSLQFQIRYFQPFLWIINPNNDGSLYTQQEIMRLSPNGTLAVGTVTASHFIGMNYSDIQNTPQIPDDTNCSVDNSCPLITYDSETANWDKNASDDLSVNGGTINGNLNINGNLQVIGSILNATVTNQYLNGSFSPSLSNTFNLGSSDFPWQNVYATNIIGTIDWNNISNKPVILNGTNGIDGINGTNGVNGSQGLQGIQGIPGLNGSQGPQGIPGINGTVGINGTNGINGTAGINGLNGTNGINGSAGINGLNGTNGLNGSSTNITVVNLNNGLFTWVFWTGGINQYNFTTQNLSGTVGPQGTPGLNGTNGVNGSSINISSIVWSTGNMTITWSNSQSFTSPNISTIADGLLMFMTGYQITSNMTYFNASVISLIGANISALRTDNTTQGGLISALRTDNTTQGGLISALRTDNTTQSSQINGKAAAPTMFSLAVNKIIYNSTTWNDTINTVNQTIFLTNLLANQNYTIYCMLLVGSNTTAGTQFNLSSIPTVAPNMAGVMISHPTSSMAGSWSYCQGVVNTCTDLSATSVTVPSLLPVEITARLWINNTATWVLQARSGLSNSTVTIAGGSYCRISNEN